MANITSKRGRLNAHPELKVGEDQAVTSIDIHAGFDSKGPTVGWSVIFADGRNVVLEFPTEEAFALSLETLGYVEISEKKYRGDNSSYGIFQRRET